MPHETVTRSARELAVAGFYDGIFRFYESANSFLTLGLDRWWRVRAANTLKTLSPDASTALDACAGTGDFSIVLYKTYGGALKVTGADLSRAMLSKARSKTDKIEFVEAEAKALPFPDNAFDLVTVSFAARNLNIDRQLMTRALREFGRVLKDGGVFLNLETTRPENPLVNLIFRAYVKTVIGLLNLVSPASRTSYTFLRNTVLDFYGADEFSALLLEAGFKSPSYKILFPGAVAVHTAAK
ncbi:MAG: ubiquinone/menaquinone biosynthesis methyltransferase [Elusimicrobia bacterium]|nr:ubiquinone/menaquinone biosynthesis methyltransferase [Elusimicrobiota bacterium]